MTYLRQASWWAYERLWLQLKRRWANDTFIGVRICTMHQQFVVCGRAGHALVHVREVGRRTTGIIDYASTPYTSKLAGFR